MAGYNLIRRIRQLEENLDTLGLALQQSKHHYRSDVSDVVAVVPKDQDSLPLYNREAELFVGTIEQLEYWLSGIVWSRNYDTMLFGKTIDKNRLKKEQGYRHKMLVRKLKESD
jgi:hypothetical protein